MDFTCCLKPIINYVWDYYFPDDKYTNFGGLLQTKTMNLPIPHLESECDCDSDYNQFKEEYKPFMVYDTVENKHLKVAIK